MFNTNPVGYCPGFDLYTVTLDDDPAHAVTVAADNPDNAADRARRDLHVAAQFTWEPVAPVTVEYVKANPAAVAWKANAA